MSHHIQSFIDKTIHIQNRNALQIIAYQYQSVIDYQC